VVVPVSGEIRRYLAARRKHSRAARRLELERKEQWQALVDRALELDDSDVLVVSHTEARLILDAGKANGMIHQGYVQLPRRTTFLGHRVEVNG
jgi:hypothetical protein